MEKRLQILSTFTINEEERGILLELIEMEKFHLKETRKEYPRRDMTFEMILEALEEKLGKERKSERVFEIDGNFNSLRCCKCKGAINNGDKFVTKGWGIFHDKCFDEVADENEPEWWQNGENPPEINLEF